MDASKLKNIFLGGIYPDTPMVSGVDLTYKKIFSKLAKIVVSDEMVNGACEYFICIDYKKDDVELARKTGISRENSLLIRQEPSVVLPLNYSSAITEDFAYVIDIGRNPLSTNSINWPQHLFSGEPPWASVESQNKRVALINSNKTSFLKGEMYSLRKRAAKSIQFIDLYGNDWQLSLVQKTKVAKSALRGAISAKRFPRLTAIIIWFQNNPNSKGRLASKDALLRTYKYCLVIENEASYVSEKIFDSFRTGSIPIYIGPNLKPFGIPESLYVGSNPDTRAILEAIQIAKEIEPQKWRDELISWMADPKTRANWSFETFANRITTRVSECFSEL
jgi:hypothetical protein